MYVKVHVYPGMKKEIVKELAKDKYEFILKEPAERNLANKRAQSLLAEIKGVLPSQIKIVTGHRSPSKVFEVIYSKQ